MFAIMVILAMSAEMIVPMLCGDDDAAAVPAQPRRTASINKLAGPTRADRRLLHHTKLCMSNLPLSAAGEPLEQLQVVADACVGELRRVRVRVDEAWDEEGARRQASAAEAGVYRDSLGRVCARLTA